MNDPLWDEAGLQDKYLNKPNMRILIALMLFLALLAVIVKIIQLWLNCKRITLAFMCLVALLYMASIVAVFLI
jgi:hypothetical protein